MQFKNNCTCNSQIALSFALCNYLTVTGKIILELHSNVCDYLYKFLRVAYFCFDNPAQRSLSTRHLYSYRQCILIQDMKMSASVVHLVAIVLQASYIDNNVRDDVAVVLTWALRSD